MRRLLTRRSLVCQEAVELITDYMEGVLPRSDRKRLERHLAACPNCREYLAQMRATISVAGRVEPADLPAQAQEDLIEVFRRWKLDQDQEPGPLP